MYHGGRKRGTVGQRGGRCASTSNNRRPRVRRAAHKRVGWDTAACHQFLARWHAADASAAAPPSDPPVPMAIITLVWYTVPPLESVEVNVTRSLYPSWCTHSCGGIAVNGRCAGVVCWTDYHRPASSGGGQGVTWSAGPRVRCGRARCRPSWRAGSCAKAAAGSHARREPTGGAAPTPLRGRGLPARTAPRRRPR